MTPPSPRWDALGATWFGFTAQRVTRQSLAFDAIGTRPRSSDTGLTFARCYASSRIRRLVSTSPESYGHRSDESARKRAHGNQILVSELPNIQTPER